MRNKILLISLLVPSFFSASGQNVGIGESSPGSKLSVKGSLSVGAGYSTIAAPANSVIIEGNLGIGTSAPTAALDVSSTTTAANTAAIKGQTSAATATVVYGVQGVSTSTGTNAAGVYGVNNSTGLVLGVYGSSSSTTGTGVYGYATSATGASYGVFGEAASTGGIGLTGQADALGGVGVFGQNVKPSGTGAGYGVVGYTAQASTNGAGVEGENINSAGVGVLGISGSSTPIVVGGYGVSGNAINVTGNGGVVGTISTATTIKGQGVLGILSGGNYYGLGVTAGSKSAIVATGPHEHRAVFCLESAENYFEDMGEGQLVNGHATVNIDPVFLRTITIDSAHQMMVFITLLDEVPNQVYVKRGSSSFEVIESHHGSSNASFTYRIAGHRKGYENNRLNVFEEEDWERLQAQKQDTNLQNRLIRK